MTHHSSSVYGKEATGMKTKPLATILVSVVLFAGIATCAYFYWVKETPVSTSRQVASQKSSENSTGRKWFSNIPLSGPKAAADLYGIGADLNGKTVSQYVKSLHDAANKGDTKAAYNIYLAETVCTDLPQRQRELANIPANTEETYVEALQKTVKNAQNVCADFNVSPRERIDYLNAAAKGGNVSAMMAFVREAPEGVDPLKPIDPDNSRAVQWQRDSLNYMTLAAAKGDVVALISLSTLYEQGDSQTKNIPLALTYELAAQMQRHPNTNIPDNAPQISRLTSQLTPDQIAIARADATALVKSANSNQ